MKEDHKLVASFGGAAKHSVAAATYNAAFQAAALNWSYVPFRANGATLAELLARLRGEGLAGAEFDPSFREAAIGLCDKLSAEAELLQAVTTARVGDDGVEGFNVDVYAFGRVLEELAEDVSAKPVLILGVGATARACGLALERAGAKVTYAAGELTGPRPGLSSGVTVIRLEDVSSFLAAKQPALLVGAAASGGTETGPPVTYYDAIPPTCTVFDVAYGRLTPLLKAAKERDLRGADGLDMLLFAAGRAFDLWTGLDAPLDIMRRAALTDLEKLEL